MIFDLFLKPENFIFIIFVPFIIVLFLIAYNRKKKTILKYFSYKNYIENTGFEFKKNYILRTVLLTLFIILCVFSLSRPRWGNIAVNIERKGMDIILAVDISKSMNTQDLKPDRYFRVKESIKNILNKLGGDRVSLVFFAQNAFVMVPFTTDYHTIDLALDNLNPSDFPLPGTNYSNLFMKMKGMAKRSKALNKLMIIFSDGEDLEKTPDSFLKLDGFKVYTVGVGTEKGGVIPEYINGKKNGVIKYKDEIVVSRLEENNLKRIASINSGKYLRLSYDMKESKIISDDIINSKKDLIKTEKKEMKIERYRFFLLPALILLFIETFFVNYWPFYKKS